MSEIHLGKGSVQPPKVDGKLRLYSMEYCPYAQRARLVLKAKNIAHDIVNINLDDKPEWYFQVHPEGKVPALDTGTQVIIESLDIANFLDEKYPQEPLYPADVGAKKLDQEVIQKVEAISTIWYKAMFNAEPKKSVQEWSEELRPLVDFYEQELLRRGTLFFGGDQPGMVDYMIWPRAERSAAVKFVFGREFFPQDAFPPLRIWCKAMLAHPVVHSIHHTLEDQWAVIQGWINKTPIDVDNLKKK